MLKVYQFLLDRVLIFDQPKNTMIETRPLYIMKGERENMLQHRITKATVNKYRRNWHFVVSKFILSVYAPDEVSVWDQKRVENAFIGEFENWNALEDYFKSLLEQTKAEREELVYIEWATELVEAAIAVRQEKTEEAFNYKGKKREIELDLFRALSKGKAV